MYSNNNRSSSPLSPPRGSSMSFDEYSASTTTNNNNPAKGADCHSSSHLITPNPNNNNNNNSNSNNLFTSTASFSRRYSSSPSSNPYVTIRPLAPPHPLTMVVPTAARKVVQQRKTTPPPTATKMNRTVTSEEATKEDTATTTTTKQQPCNTDASSTTTTPSETATPTAASKTTSTTAPVTPVPQQEPSADASSTSSTTNNSIRENTGRWSASEHQLFVQGLERYGRGWKSIATLIKTRSVVQVRTHAQKYFQKLAKAADKTKDKQPQILPTTTATPNSNDANPNKRKQDSITFSHPLPTLSPSTSVTSLSSLTFPSSPYKKVRQVSMSATAPIAWEQSEMSSSSSSSTSFTNNNSNMMQQQQQNVAVGLHDGAGVPHTVSNASLTTSSQDMPTLDDSLLYLLEDGSSFDPEPVPLALLSTTTSNSAVVEETTRNHHDLGTSSVSNTNEISFNNNRADSVVSPVTFSNASNNNMYDNSSCQNSNDNHSSVSNDKSTNSYNNNNNNYSIDFDECQYNINNSNNDQYDQGSIMKDHNSTQFSIKSSANHNEMDALLDICDPLDWLTDMSMKESFQLPPPEDVDCDDTTNNSNINSNTIASLVSSSQGFNYTGSEYVANRVLNVNVDALLEVDDF